ncbi:hypothetical protein PAXINDRAFT_98926 [Paxillus involutus ATCC 200175]|nr:hypothetical protein PAXINDRAFT_98926 [Paxillus involutus ATCC 200175]
MAATRTGHLAARRVGNMNLTAGFQTFRFHYCRQAGFTLQGLPHDIIYHITTFLGVLDLISLQEALPSLSAQNVSYLLWSRVYRNSSLPRPPGPLALAEINSHIMTLKQSACLQRMWAEVRAKEAGRLSTMWTYSAMKESESQFGRKRTLDLSFKDSREGKFAVVFSRWLFVAIPREDCVVCHDLNAPDDDLGKFTKVYKSQEADILHFACAESTGLNGQPIAFAAVKERRRNSSHSHSFVIKILKVEAPPFSSPGDVMQTQLKEVLVSITGWRSSTFTITLSPTLLVVADDSKDINELGVICMGAASFERYRLSFEKTLGLFKPVAITFVPCTTYVLVIRVFMRGIPVEGGGCTSVVDAYDIERPFAPGSNVLRLLQHTHRGTTDYFIRDAKLLDDPAYSAASARIIPVSIAALRGFCTHPLNPQLTITATFVGIRNLSRPLKSSFLGILRMVLSPVEARMGPPPILGEGSFHGWRLPRTSSTIQTTIVPPTFKPFGEIAIEYTPLYILPAPLRLTFFQSTINGSTRGIIFMPSEEQATDAYKARSSPVLPIFEGVCIRLNTRDEEETEPIGDIWTAHHPSFQFFNGPAVPETTSSSHFAPVKIDVTSLPYVPTIFPPTLLAFDGIRGRMVSVRLGALSPGRLEHWPKIEVWDCC